MKNRIPCIFNIGAFKIFRMPEKHVFSERIGKNRKSRIGDINSLTGILTDNIEMIILVIPAHKIIPVIDIQKIVIGFFQQNLNRGELSRGKFQPVKSAVV